MKEVSLTTPVSMNQIADLKIGDFILVSGYIYTARDAVLPKLKLLFEQNKLEQYGIDLLGSVMFHTAVSPAGIGPTSSNKYDIESSIPVLSQAGVKIHIGKGALKKSTIESLNQYKSVYAITPPISALLSSKIRSTQIIAFPEQGMEALHLLKVEDFPAIVYAIHGHSINSLSDCIK